MREVDEDAEAVACAHELAPGLGQPAADVGRRREAKRHAFCEVVGSRPDEPDRPQPAVVPRLEIREVGCDRLGALHVHDRRHLPVDEVRGRGRAPNRQCAELLEELLGDALRLRVWDRVRQRYRVGNLRRIGPVRRRHVQREEPACEAGGPRGLQIHVLRRLAAPAPQDEIVVPVDDHCRILRAGVAGSAFVNDAPLSIVICEDDERLAALVEENLDRDGRFLVVGHAADGDSAIRLVDEHTPDVVLMDIGMPGPRRDRGDARDPRTRPEPSRRHLHGLGRVRRRRARRRGGRGRASCTSTRSPRPTSPTPCTCCT